MVGSPFGGCQCPGPQDAATGTKPTQLAHRELGGNKGGGGDTCIERADSDGDVRVEPLEGRLLPKGSDPLDVGRPRRVAVGPERVLCAVSVSLVTEPLQAFHQTTVKGRELAGELDTERR